MKESRVTREKGPPPSKTRGRKKVDDIRETSNKKVAFFRQNVLLRPQQLWVGRREEREKSAALSRGMEAPSLGKTVNNGGGKEIEANAVNGKRED